MCSCKNKTAGGKARNSYQVKLPGGMVVTKSSEAAATAFAARHPGSKVVKVA
jgi:hypothetical protein